MKPYIHSSNCLASVHTSHSPIKTLHPSFSPTPTHQNIIHPPNPHPSTIKHPSNPPPTDQTHAIQSNHPLIHPALNLSVNPPFKPYERANDPSKELHHKCKEQNQSTSAQKTIIKCYTSSTDQTEPNQIHPLISDDDDELWDVVKGSVRRDLS